MTAAANLLLLSLHCEGGEEGPLSHPAGGRGLNCPVSGKLCNHRTPVIAPSGGAVGCVYIRLQRGGRGPAPCLISLGKSGGVAGVLLVPSSRGIVPPLQTNPQAQYTLGVVCDGALQGGTSAARPRLSAPPWLLVGHLWSLLAPSVLLVWRQLKRQSPSYLSCALCGCSCPIAPP